MKLIINKNEFDLKSKEDLKDKIKENSNLICNCIVLKAENGSKLSVLNNRNEGMARIYFNNRIKYYTINSKEIFFSCNGNVYSDDRVASNKEALEAILDFYETGNCKIAEVV